VFLFLLDLLLDLLSLLAIFTSCLSTVKRCVQSLTDIPQRLIQVALVLFSQRLIRFLLLQLILFMSLRLVFLFGVSTNHRHELPRRLLQIFASSLPK